MQVIAHRDKDMQDVEGLLDAHPEVNLDEIRPIRERVRRCHLHARVD
jgi:hypothetical protein